MTVLAMVSVALTNCAMDEDQSMPATSVKPKVTMDQVEAKIAQLGLKPTTLKEGQKAIRFESPEEAMAFLTKLEKLKKGEVEFKTQKKTLLSRSGSGKEMNISISPKYLTGSVLKSRAEQGEKEISLTGNEWDDYYPVCSFKVTKVGERWELDTESVSGGFYVSGSGLAAIDGNFALDYYKHQGSSLFVSISVWCQIEVIGSGEYFMVDHTFEHWVYDQ